MRLLLRLVSIAALPIVGLASSSASAAPAPGQLEPAAANGGATKVQYLEIDPPAAVDDDDYGGSPYDAVGRCAAQFRSFEPQTGYYTTYDGERVLCPYLQ
jgi:energy-converting hydrogenase Eha subunit F